MLARACREVRHDCVAPSTRRLLSLRRFLGYTLQRPEKLPHQFLDFLDSKLDKPQATQPQPPPGQESDINTLIEQLARQLNDGSIASLLNRLGHRSGKGHTWTELRLRSYRNDHGIAVYREGEREQRGEVTLKQAAKTLGCSG